MASLNKVMIIGNAGRDAEMRYTANGTAMTTFSVAVNRNFRGRDGDWQKETEWFNVVVWADQAERVGTWLTKGKLVYVEGRMQTRSWDDDQGVKQYRTELVAQTVQPLDRREDSDGGGWGGDEERGGGFDRRERSAPARGGRSSSSFDMDPDDLPFE